MTHKGHWQCHRCSSQTEPRIPLKLGLETMTHVLKRRHNATTALWTLKSKHTLTLTPYGIGDHAAVYAVCTSFDTMRSVCFTPGLRRIELWDTHIQIPDDYSELCLFELIYFASEAVQKKIMKYNNKNSLFHIPPLAVCCTPHCISLHETCWNMINSWMSLSLLASLNQ